MRASPVLGGRKHQETFEFPDDENMDDELAYDIMEGVNCVLN